MNPVNRESLQEVHRLFSEALDLEPWARETFLVERCGDDEPLRRAVEQLLADAALLESRDASADATPASAATLSVNLDSGAAAARESPSSLTPPRPETVGPYSLIRVLGEGGMGIVYLAEQTQPLRRQVALKLVKAGMDTQEVLRRFEAERQALAQLNHPAIAKVFDAGSTAAGRPYFAMEYVDGVRIDKYCDSERLPIKDRLRLFVEACRGVEHAHRRGLLHRDLKPSNILVSSSDGAPLVKIIDFGLARATDASLVAQSLYTELGHIVGTPAYMSPEQASLTGEGIDERTDVYSLGVVLYELLVGHLPLEVDVRQVAFDELIRRIREDDPPTPSTRWSRLNLECTSDLAMLRRSSRSSLQSELRGDLDAITAKALEKAPRRRYESARDLADDIERHLDGRPVLARPPSLAYRGRKFVRRHRTLTVAVAAVLIALSAGLIVSWMNYRLATERLDSVRRLADVKLLADLERETEQLWPILEKQDEMDDWSARAESLLVGLDEHRRTLRTLTERAEAAASTALPAGRYSGDFSAEEILWQRGVLDELVRGLERFGTQTLPEIRNRRERARALYQASVVDAKDEWQRASEAIAATDRSPAYNGLRIMTQPGLVPIGRDPQSGLFEFADLRTGAAARRGGDGSLMLDEGIGVVFVLIPASVSGAAGRAPFLVSKYEMTNGQWKRAGGVLPSRTTAMKSRNPEGQNDLHPVALVNWEDCAQLLRRLGMRFPSGREWRLLRKNERTAADRAQDAGKPTTFARAPARIGASVANRLGIHDLAGNVAEWCADAPDREAWQGQQAFNPQSVRVILGGSFDEAEASEPEGPLQQRYDAIDRPARDVGLRAVLDLR